MQQPPLSLFAPSHSRKRARPSASASGEEHRNANRGGDGGGDSGDSDAPSLAPASSPFGESFFGAASSGEPHLASKPTTFTALGLSQRMAAACSAMGIRIPTPVQVGCIPAVLRGIDVVASAPTGSGKTAAFALPILQRLAMDPYGIFAIVLTPSRELALQISEQFVALGAPIGVRVATVVGGLDIVRQSAALSELPHVVVATPGRLAHLINLGVALSAGTMGRVGVLVLDEADRLLDDSMASDLRVILDALDVGVSSSGGSSSKRAGGRLQTLLFSATLDMAIAASSSADGAASSGSGGGGSIAREFLQRLHLHKPLLFSAAAGSVSAEALLGSSTGTSCSSSSTSAVMGGDGASSTTIAPLLAATGAASSTPSSALLALPKLPVTLRQEYLFIPDAVKAVYLFALLRVCMGEDVVAVKTARRDAAPISSSRGGAAAAARGGGRGGGGRSRGGGHQTTRKPPSLLQSQQQRRKQSAGGALLRLRSTADDDDRALSAVERSASAALEAVIERAATGTGALDGSSSSREGGAGASSSSSRARPRSSAAAAASAAAERHPQRNQQRLDDDGDDDDDRSDTSGDTSGETSGGNDENSSDDDSAGGGGGSASSDSANDDNDDGDDDDDYDEASVDSGGDPKSRRRILPGDSDENDGDQDDAGSGSEYSNSSGDDDDDADRPAITTSSPAICRSAIIFVSTVRFAHLTAETLMELGIPCVALHSGLRQPARTASLAKFKSSLVRVLVATDVASRGLDIPSVDLVINADVPGLPTDYVHRVGRTARAGRSGRAVTLVTQYDVELLQAVENGVLGGARLPSFTPALSEEAVLASMGKVSQAGKLAAARLTSSGFEEMLAVRAERNNAAVVEGRRKTQQGTQTRQQRGPRPQLQHTQQQREQGT